MPCVTDDVRSRLAALRERLVARAAGFWSVNGDRLDQVAFDAAPDMPADVSERFRIATLSVPLDRHDLGIVSACRSGIRSVSLASNLPEDVGSGYWLRAFDAGRSVAVPLVDRSGTVVAIISIALGVDDPPDEEIESILKTEVAGWLRPD